jgi:hypothetical protein
MASLAPSGCAGSSVPSSSSERSDMVQRTHPKHGSCPLCGPWATMRRRGHNSRRMSSASNRTFVRHIPLPLLPSTAYTRSTLTTHRVCMPGYPCLLLSPPLEPVDQPGPERAETAWPDPSQPARRRSESRSESVGSIRVCRPDPSLSLPARSHDPSRPARSESARTDPSPSLCPLQIRPFHLPVRFSHGDHSSQVHYL